MSAVGDGFPARTIVEHVLRYPVSARIELLTHLLSCYEQVDKDSRQYPLEISHFGPDKGWRAVIFHHGSDGFSIDGWINALWASL